MGINLINDFPSRGGWRFEVYFKYSTSIALPSPLDKETDTDLSEVEKYRFGVPFLKHFKCLHLKNPF